MGEDVIALSLIAAAAAAVLQPTSKWQVNFDESQCVASREYETGGQPLTLLFKAPASGDVIQVGIAVREGGSPDPEQLSGKLAWGTSAPLETSALSFRSVGASRKLFIINRPRRRRRPRPAGD